MDLESDHTNDVGRSCSAGLGIREGVDESRVVEWYIDADCQTPENEESGETVEHSIVGLWHDDTWVLSLASSLLDVSNGQSNDRTSAYHRDVVRSSDRETGLDKTLKEPEEIARLIVVV